MFGVAVFFTKSICYALTLVLLTSVARAQESEEPPPPVMIPDEQPVEPPPPAPVVEEGQPQNQPQDLPPPPQPVAKKVAKTKAKKKRFEKAPVDPEQYAKNRESRFHQIYMQYNQNPLSETQWDLITKDRKNESYKIQKGDSLWGISETLFGDGYYWSKVWAVNSDITNPHEILPDSSINFYPGSSGEAPAVVLARSQSGEKLPEQPPVVPVNESSLPAPLRTYKPVGKIPPSLPQWAMEILPPNSADAFILDIKNQRNPTPLLYLDHFVTESPLISKGTIIETETTDQIASDFQYVYVKLEAGTEKHFSVVRKLGVVNDPERLLGGADLYEVQGEVEVIGSVDVTKNLYRAIVRKTVNPVSVGGILITGAIPRFSMEQTGNKQTIETTIIGGSSNTHREIYGLQAIVFLNKGAEAGINPGMLLPVLANPQVRKKNSSVERLVRQIAMVKTLKVTPKYSTAVVLWANEEVRTGDKTGAFGSYATKLEDISAGQNPTAQYDEQGVDLGGEPTDTQPQNEAF